VDEIVSAKSKLFEGLDDIRTAGHVNGGKHRPIQCKANDNKRPLDADDLLSLYADLDAAKAPLPTFTAGNLRRIPPFEPDATDLLLGDDGSSAAFSNGCASGWAQQGHRQFCKCSQVVC